MMESLTVAGILLSVGSLLIYAYYEIIYLIERKKMRDEFRHMMTKWKWEEVEK